MKQCPECGELFDEQKAFCDMDGAELIQAVSSNAVSQNSSSASAGSMWVTGVIGGLIGIFVCVMLYLLFLAPARETAQRDDQNNQNTESTAPKTNVAVAPIGQRPPSEIASPTESPSPEASPTATPVPTATPPSPALNKGPIATGGKTSGNSEHAIIKMKDGSTVEADAAWEDKQGIWYRRGNVVSFLDKSKVESISEPPPKPAETKTP